MRQLYDIKEYIDFTCSKINKCVKLVRQSAEETIYQIWTKLPEKDQYIVVNNVKNTIYGMWKILHKFQPRWSSIVYFVFQHTFYSIAKLYFIKKT